MKRKLIFIFFLVLIVIFLIFPSVTHTESTYGCSDNAFANCSPVRTTGYGQLLGGAKYLKASINKGRSDDLVQSAPVRNGGSYESENQYFTPLLAIMGAILVSTVVTAIIYLHISKRKPKSKS